MKQREVKEGHEKAIGHQLLRALKLDAKFLRHGEADLLYSLDGKTVGKKFPASMDCGMAPALVPIPL